MDKQQYPLQRDNSSTISLDKTEETVMLQDANETVMLQDANETVMLQDANETVMLQDANETVMLQDADGTVLPEGAKTTGTPVNREIYQLVRGEVLQQRYEIEDVLGFGGFGITYSAYDKKLNLKVAVKEYYPASIVNRNPGEKEVRVLSEKKKREYQRGIDRFLGEAQNTVQFSSCKNIVNVFNYFKENGTAYLVMEYLDGVTLKQYTANSGGKLSYEEVTNITLSIISALRQLHKKNIIHRDISPDNIFICKDGTVKLIDFGAARFTEDSEEEKTRSIILKPGFSPPEQYQSKGKQGPWTDIYALGATMYRTVTGCVPEESTDRSIKDELKDPCFYVKDIPKYLNNILMKCVAIQPELRFQNVDALENALNRKKKVNSTKKELARRKIRRGILIAAVFVLLVVFGIKEYSYIKEIRDKANLVATNITVWVPVSADQESAKQEQTQFEEEIADFKTEYPAVTLDITYIDKTDYEEKIKTALQEGTAPTLFDSTVLHLQKQDMANLEDTTKLVDTSDYQFGNAGFQYGYGEQIATGYNVPILYENTVLSQDGTDAAGENDREKFLAGESRYYVGTMDDYKEIQTALAGIYSVSVADAAKVEFTNVWSVNSSQKEEQITAAGRVIYYLLSEQAQDAWFVQGDHGIPMEKNSLQTYIDINPELKFVQDANNETSEIVTLDEKTLDGLYQDIVKK